MSEGILSGTTGVVFGVANKRSIAWAIAKAWHKAGATLIFNYQGERLKQNVEELVSEFGSDVALFPCDVTKDEETDAFFAKVRERAPKLDLPVDVQATAFQWKVWRHLQSIPYGETRAYSQVAEDLGVPSATRAVARACATNRVCLVIPCHRVVQKGGGLGGYRWGIERKRKLLQKEKQ